MQPDLNLRLKLKALKNLLCLSQTSLYFLPPCVCDITRHFYRVSSKGVYAFLLPISQDPVGLGLQFWTFFNSPVYVDNKTGLNFIPRCFLGRDI